MNRRTPRVPATVSVLAPFVEAGVFGSSEVQLVESVDRLRRAGTGPLDPAEALALAVAARAPRLGHVCLALDEVAARIVESEAEDLELPWPEPEAWAAALEASDLVRRPGEEVAGPVRPLVWDGRRLYLHRYEAYERAVADDLTARADTPVADAAAAVDLDALFPPSADGSIDRQRRAAEVALAHRVSVIAGGPGTGKTRTIARLLAAALAAEGSTVGEFALAAPTGKAATRMTEAVHAAVAEAGEAGMVDAAVIDRLRSAEATTIHRLLGARPGSGFSRDRSNPLPHDLVIVDETSMVALPLMARLLDAVRPEARVVLVGDPDQLASVEAGTVLADLVGPARSTPDAPVSGPLADRVTVLDRVHRFGAASGIAELADAVRSGDVDRTLSLLDGSRADLRLVQPGSPAEDGVLGELVELGVRVVEEARTGRSDAALAAASGVKVLAAVNRGPNGRFDWEQRVERGVLDRVGDVDRSGSWHIGRPVLITTNDGLNRVFNGDTGVTVSGDGGLLVALPDARDPGGVRLLPPARLREVETWWSMTIHKSQGSEFSHVVVALPDRAESPVLTRELLYTAITRARERVTLLASEASLRAAVARPVARASGLADRLWR